MGKKLHQFFVNPSDAIKSVLDKINNTKLENPSLPTGIVLVADRTGRLIGIATDGDIRRALSSGVSIEDNISKIMNKNPFLIVGPKSNLEILSIITEKIRTKNWHKDRLNKIIVVDEMKRPIDLVSFYDLWQKSDVRFKQIGVLGLGYVGLTLALTLADLGFKSKGFDINPVVIKNLKSGKPHFFENGLEGLLKDNLGKNFEVVDNFEGQNNCDVYFIAVGTPLNSNKKPNLDFLKIASQKIGKILKNGDAVILRSTVPIGTTRSIVIPILEKYSKLKACDDFFVAFAPERTVEGKALEELKKLPQVIGGVNWAS
ncbi:MAG: CBS domain-containing protein, partial [Patescibacteria group bacterium]